MPALLGKIETTIINPLILLVFAVALVYFLYGVYEFVRDADSEDGREKGRNAILWGVIGMFIMIAVFGIIRVALNTFTIPIPSTISQSQ